MSLKPYSFRHDGATYTFVTEPEIAEHQSKIAGRKVYIDQEKCKVQIPSMGPPKQANSDCITQDWLDFMDGYGRLDHPTTIFHDHYDRWKAGQASASIGTPLANMPELTPAMLKTLEASRIDCLEALAQMDPEQLSKAFGPQARSLIERAKELTAPVNPDVQAVREQNAKLSDQVEAQAAQMEEMRKQLAALTASKGKGKPSEAAAA